MILSLYDVGADSGITILVIPGGGDSENIVKKLAILLGILYPIFRKGKFPYLTQHMLLRDSMH
jgi:hypothetical protein